MQYLEGKLFALTPRPRSLVSGHPSVFGVSVSKRQQTCSLPDLVLDFCQKLIPSCKFVMSNQIIRGVRRAWKKICIVLLLVLEHDIVL